MMVGEFTTSRLPTKVPLAVYIGECANGGSSVSADQAPIDQIKPWAGGECEINPLILIHISCPNMREVNDLRLEHVRGYTKSGGWV